jgi:glycosyltransferase involved in cell wall biosynthesis
MTVYINGRFLTKRTTGVQRFAREVVWAMDGILAVQNGKTDQPYVLVAPRGTICDMGLTAIEFRTVGRGSGLAWEQAALYRESRDGILINLANSAPILHPRNFVVVHDAMIYRTPQNYALQHRLIHRLMDTAFRLRSVVGTVSEFSQGELRETVGLRARYVLPNAADHMLRHDAGDDVLVRLRLVRGEYLFFVGSPTPNKNLSAVVEALSHLESAPPFVVVGVKESSVFAGKAAYSDRIQFVGRLSDEDVVALYRGARALVFPSLYEGFGIPPLEAMLLGCPVLASDIAPVREVCGDAAIYFDPHNPVTIAAAIQSLRKDDDLRADLIAKGLNRSRSFSWKKTAIMVLNAVSEIS